MGKNKYKRIVVKIGSSCITNSKGIIAKSINRIAADCAKLHNEGTEIVLVSSGAIQLARSYETSIGTRDIAELQALSAIGQPKLMRAYDKAFAKRKLTVAQILLTHQDLGAKVRSLNTINTITKIIENKIIPIVNENDTISYSEITVGDNDHLAAMVAQAIDAELLIIMTEPDGVFTENPSRLSAKKIEKVKPCDTLQGVTLKGRSSSGRGGMESKISAIRRITPGGIPAIICTMHIDKPILSALSGGGTFFEPEKKQLTTRQERLVATAKSGANLSIDHGALNAIKKGSSLLPSGVLGCHGVFKRGDSITIKMGKRIVAHGVAEYSSKEVLKIKGLNTKNLKEILPQSHSKVIVHRNNLVLVR